jgi:hypothetical protein
MCSGRPGKLLATPNREPEWLAVREVKHKFIALSAFTEAATLDVSSNKCLRGPCGPVVAVPETSQAIGAPQKTAISRNGVRPELPRLPFDSSVAVAAISPN